MPKIIQRLQDIGFCYGTGLESHELDYGETIGDGWIIAQSAENNMIAIMHHSGILAIDAKTIGNPQMFWDATKELIADELAQVFNQTKQLSLF